MASYLALGDSMSIDDYTGVPGGGAVAQFFTWLGSEWTLDDRTSDGCLMPDVPRDAVGDIITLTIGGNDLLWNRSHFLQHGLTDFANEHRRLLEAIRDRNPTALFIVGDIYHPQAALSQPEQAALSEANRIIRQNGARVGAQLAPIHDAFRGHEDRYLCLQIEPTLAGATAIAKLFRNIVEEQRP